MDMVLGSRSAKVTKPGVSAIAGIGEPSESNLPRIQTPNEFPQLSPTSHE